MGGGYSLSSTRSVATPLFYVPPDVASNAYFYRRGVLFSLHSNFRYVLTTVFVIENIRHSDRYWEKANCRSMVTFWEMGVGKAMRFRTSILFIYPWMLRAMHIFTGGEYYFCSKIFFEQYSPPIL